MSENTLQRAAFEAQFPMPRDCVWCGSGYAPTSYNAWDAQAYAHKWEGWKAAIAQDRQSRGEPDYLISACYFPKAGEVELSWERKEDGAKAGLTCKVTPDQGSQIANVIWPCVHHTASAQPAEPVKVPSPDEIEAVFQAHDAMSGLTQLKCLAIGRDLLASYGKAAQAAASAEPVATVTDWVNGSYHRKYQITWHKDVPAGTKLFDAPIAAQPSVSVNMLAVKAAIRKALTRQYTSADEALSGMGRDVEVIADAVCATLSNATPPADRQAQQDADKVDAERWQHLAREYCNSKGFDFDGGFFRSFSEFTEHIDKGRAEQESKP